MNASSTITSARYLRSSSDEAVSEPCSRHPASTTSGTSSTDIAISARPTPSTPSAYDAPMAGIHW